MKVNYGDSVGSFFVQYRKIKGLSQRELARMLGDVHPQYISNIERGVAPRPTSTCKIFFKYLPKREQKILYGLLAAAVMDFTLEKLGE